MCQYMSSLSEWASHDQPDSCAFYQAPLSVKLLCCLLNTDTQGGQGGQALVKPHIVSCMSANDRFWGEAYYPMAKA